MPTRVLTAAIITGLTVLPAQASGGLWCDAEGEAVRLSVQAGVTRGMGGAIFSFEGAVDVTDERVAPDLAATEYEREHVAQYWLDGEEMRLLLYREREGEEPHGYAQLTIVAQADGEGGYGGTYVLEFYDMQRGDDGSPVAFEGAVDCGAE
jgi:hypothetical protein